MIAGGLKGHIGIEDMERRALAGGEGAYTDLVDEELPPLERVYARVRSNEEEVRGAKIVEWGWRDLQPDDAEPLAEILCLATNAVDLRLYVNEVGPTGGPGRGPGFKRSPNNRKVAAGRGRQHLIIGNLPQGGAANIAKSEIGRR